MDAGTPTPPPGTQAGPGPTLRLPGVAMPDPSSTTGAWITGLAVDVSSTGMVILWPDGVRRWEMAWPVVVSAGRGAPGRYSDGTPNETLDVTTADRTVHLVAPATVLTADAFASIAAARTGGVAVAPMTAPQPVVPVGPVGRPAPVAWAPAAAAGQTGWETATRAPLPGWQAEGQAAPAGWQSTAPGGSPWSGALVPATTPPAQAPARHGDGRTRRIAVIAAAAVLLIAAVGTTAWTLAGGHTDALSGKTPAQVVELSQAAAVKSGSFHYVSTSGFTDSSGTTTMTTVGDAGKTSGTQQITQGQDVFTIDVVGTGVYFKGNAAALGDQLGLTTAAATANAGKWISLAPTDAPTPSVEAGVTSSDFFTAPCLLQPLLPGTPVALSRGTVDGQSVGKVQCTINTTAGSGSSAVSSSGTGTLSVATAAPNLPVRSAAAYTTTGPSDSGSGTSVVDFSKWGEPVTVTAPTGTIPYSSLPVQTTPPGQSQLPSTTTA